MYNSIKLTVLSVIGAFTAGVLISEPVDRNRQQPRAQAEITTDRASYEPGSVAYIVGSRYPPKETVTLQVKRVDGAPATGAGHQPWSVQVNRRGDFVTEWTVCDEDCPGFELQISGTGEVSGLTAVVSLSDGTQSIDF